MRSRCAKVILSVSPPIISLLLPPEFPLPLFKTWSQKSEEFILCLALWLWQRWSGPQMESMTNLRVPVKEDWKSVYSHLAFGGPFGSLWVVLSPFFLQCRLNSISESFSSSRADILHAALPMSELGMREKRKEAFDVFPTCTVRMTRD